MKEKNVSSGKKSNIEKTLKALTTEREAPKFTIVFFVLLYIISSAIVMLVARTPGTISIAGNLVPISTFTGVFSSLANICIIFMTVYYKKFGYITSIIILAIQLPIMLAGIIGRGNLTSIPGLFTNLLTLTASTIIFLNSIKIDKYQKKMRDQAITDRLTKLPNRYAGSELIEQLVKQGKKFAVVSIDLNNFKSINETMGQNIGNEVLIEVASRWKAIADTGISGTLDFITRQGGDEFSLIIRGYYSADELLKTVKYYESALENKITADECDFYITASFGYAEYPTDAEKGDMLFSCATAAMNEVKRINSSDHILHFSSGLLKVEHTMEIESKIREALENDSVFFHLQPQYDMSHKLRGFEALARMKDPDGSLISPGEFIPVAEKVGLIDKVDSAVFRKSAAFFGRLIKEYDADITLSVNVSVRHLMKNGFLNEIREIIENSGVPVGQLEIEITESVMIDSADKALTCINELKKMGLKIAIDDFGTGYSSLSYLHSFPADLLKIDKSFIDKLSSGGSSEQYVASIISIGHIMGFDVISEGVEDPGQLDTLRDIGCDYIQGFIWGRPLPEEEAEKIVVGQSA